jgi:hypothetical protein
MKALARPVVTLCAVALVLTGWAARGEEGALQSVPAPQPQATAPAAAPTPAPSEPSSWKFAGDIRLRYERTTQQQPTAQPLVLDPRNKEVLRFRAGATKAIGTRVNFGVRVATGSAEDPNSTDVTLGDFSDDLELNLDRAFVEVKHRGVFLTGGRFANPLATTELVWDSDVNPQGVAASFSVSGSERVKPKLVGMFYVVDEQATNLDSFMAGGQAQVTIRPSSVWSFVLAGGYYDYEIKSLRNADTGDTRTNRLRADASTYVSDFDLLDGVVTIDHRGFGKRCPIRFVGDWVKNLGADDEDEGFGLDLFVGRAEDKGDMRFRYGYAQAETDAVFAAFSHDNTTLATNYRQHTASFDYQVRKEIQLNATWYCYRKRHGSPADPNPWITRLRVNGLVTF